jgi:acetyltransferase-like isoleucine patch superfamily enzyme
MMKNRLKAILVRSGLLRIWNRHLGGNRTRVFGAGNQIHIGRSLLTQTRIRIEGRHNLVTIGDGCRLRDLKIIVVGENLRVSIAEHCQLRGKIKVEDTGSQISVGAGTTMENGYLGAYEGTSITVGNDCMFSDQVGIRTGDMHSILDSATQDRLNPSDSITIQPRVWLCRGVTVLKGCTIGSDTVVGGYSIVTDSLPAGVLAVGSPAKVIRQGITWKRERVASGQPASSNSPD